MSKLAREPPPTMLEKLAYGAPNGAGWIRRGENSGRCYVSLSPAAPGGMPRKLNAGLHHK